jgi:sigma-54 specific flagellar transcriptional regulator A
VEQELISQAMAASDGVVAHAAELLAMRRTTLVEKINKYKIA